MKSFPLFVDLLALAGSAVGETFYPADDSRFAYAGRWQLDPEKGVATADWPCSSVLFSVTTTTGAATSIGVRLNLRRLRIKVDVTDPTTGTVANSTILEGNAVIDFDKTYDIPLENGNGPGTYTVSLTKLTQAAPYGNGLGKLLTSIFEFKGIEMDESLATLGPSSPPLPSRRVAFVGASDTAGYCVDGTPETDDATLNPWKYDNCDEANPGVLGRRLDAGVSVQAIAGIGLTQNAFAETPMLLGENTMPDYYNRTLQTEEEPIWNFTQWRPDLVVVSLGGNDYNHQKTVPSNETFTAAYEDFLLQIAEPYLENNSTPPTIVSICGQGDPTEVERDPNNDRCRPCPHVQEAVASFKDKHGETIRAEYIFIPCDGTVVTGDGDIGCEGHKNCLGQEKVADFLEPQLREIMGWPLNETSELNPPAKSNVELPQTVLFGRIVKWLQRLSTFVAIWAAL